jgi:glyceraldehyde 3-phosphate dehydrogenase
MVLPEIRQIGFMADSVRVPVSAVSLAILNLTFQSAMVSAEASSISRSVVNGIYADAAAGSQRGNLIYSEEQNVPADLAGMRAAVVIEGVETHTRTGFVNVDLAALPGVDEETLGSLDSSVVDIPVTHAKIFGWYDNEFGSYTNLLGDLTVHVHERLDA